MRRVPLLVLYMVPVWAEAAAPAVQPQREPAVLYSRHCAVCHGTEGSGQGPKGERLPGGRLSDAKDEADLSRLLNVVLNGRGAMPGFRARLSEAEAQRLLAVRTLRPPKRR